MQTVCTCCGAHDTSNPSEQDTAALPQAVGELSHLKAALTLHVHEEAVWRLHKPLGLVLLLLHICWWMQKVNIAREHLQQVSHTMRLHPRRGAFPLIPALLEVPSGANIAAIPQCVSTAEKTSCCQDKRQLAARGARGVADKRTMIAQPPCALCACCTPATMNAALP